MKNIKLTSSQVRLIRSLVKREKENTVFIIGKENSLTIELGKILAKLEVSK
jgi:hypothetical protein